MAACLVLTPRPVDAQTRALTTNNRTILGSSEDLTAGVTFVDVDGDQDLDVIYANGRHWAQLNEVYLNNGVGQFTVGFALGPEKATTYATPAGDLDHDGDVDVVVGNDRAENWVYLNDGHGRFELAWSVGPEVEPTRSAQLYDLNGDGSLDVFVTNRGTANGFYLNDGTGHFGPKVEFGEADGSTIAVAIGDVDADGHPDLVLANRDGQANQILINDGNLGFDRAVEFGTGSDETRSVALADLDGNGTLDIVAVNIGEPNATYMGRGDGTFAPGLMFGGNEQTYAVVVTDV
ncbi:MAG: VCBS repeat-containing protein, partial [Gemmatimonadales bacterium]|nr:VCBS repeat-containing protein [Gemmatimonadales bacterium]